MTVPKVFYGRMKAQAAFSSRNGMFLDHVPFLHGSAEKILLPGITTDGSADGVIYVLNRMIAEDFMEILLLAGNGYGVGAQRLLRGLFERLVASVYVEQEPTQAMRFIDFGVIQRRKYMNHKRELHGVDVLQSDDRRALEDEYQRIKGQFEEIYCKGCGSTKMAPSWSPLDTLAMARQVKLEGLYVDCFFEPTMQLHNTVWAFGGRVKERGESTLVFDEGPQPEVADRTIRLAHTCLVLTLDHHNDHFKLGHKALIDKLQVDLKHCWESMSPKTSPGSPTI